MNLSRPDRRERLDRLAAEYALGTSPPHVRRRLTAIARTDATVAAALSEWERRIAVLADDVPAVTPPPRVWQQIAASLGLDGEKAPGANNRWWQRLGFWRAVAIASFVAAVALGVAQWQRTTLGPAAPLVVVLAGSDAKPALIATAAQGDRYLTLKRIGNVVPAPGRVFELWALPPAGAPKTLGVIAEGPLSRVPLTNSVEASLSNITGLAISLEPPGGSPTGAPTGPVLYSGPIERMY
jgi:anti-sigma-K factor RskA